MAAATTTIPTRWFAAATASCRSTSTFPAARRPLKRCSTASCNCRTRSRERTRSHANARAHSTMTPRIQKLFDALSQDGLSPKERLNEITVEAPSADYRKICERLRDQHGFEQLIDLCGVDYAAYADVPREGPRFASVVHLLSVKNNVRLR